MALAGIDFGLALGQEDSVTLKGKLEFEGIPDEKKLREKIERYLT